MVIPVSAQYHFDSWTTENGLPHNAISSIVQTRDGYLWLASLDGLVRYDGVRFTVFNTGNTPGLKSNRCTSVFEDRTGVLWIGTEDGGVVKYRDGVFTAYTTEQGLPANIVRRIWEDDAGQLLMLIQNKFYRWNNDKAEPYPVDSIAPLGLDYTNQQTGSVWFFDVSGLNILANGHITTLTKASGLSSLDANVIYKDRGGAIWVGMNKSGLNRIKDGIVTRFTVKDGLPENSVRTIAADRFGNIWFAVGYSGLVQYKDGKFTHYATTQKAGDDIVLTIYEDREGTLWLGTTGGLRRLSRDVVKVYSDQNGLPANNIYPIIEDHAGSIWLGAWPKGLVRFSNGQFTLFDKKDGMQNLLLTAFAEDHEGTLWIGSYNNLAQYKDGRFAAVQRPLVPQIKYVSAILPDRAGAIWIGADIGLIKFDNDTTTAYTTKDGLAGDDVKAILEDHQGVLWIGSYGGLTRYENGRWQKFTTQNGLAGDKVRSLYEDRDGVLWVGTYDGGLSRIKDGKIVSFAPKDGLYNNGVFQILEDDRGNFWMSCNLGIYRVSKQQLNDFADSKVKFITSVAFGTHDGMTNVECNGGTQPAGCRTRDGRLWFPTQGGAAVIDPNDIPINPTPPPVVIENCVLDRAAADCRQGITLSPSQQNLEVSYTGLSFVKPEQVRFKYRLIPLDKDWIDVGTRRTAYFSHLPPGTYTFDVIAANSDGVWNNQGQSLRIVVIPPYWQTWWFLSLMTIGVIATIFLVYRQRVLQLERRHALQQAFSRQLIESQETERKRISAELHDSLGQSLAIIKNHALFGLQETADLEMTREQLKHISGQSANAIDEVKEISYNLRPYLLDRLGLTKAVESMLSRVAESSGIDFKIELDDVDGIFSADEEINFYRIMQECVNNIVKHSSAASGEVKIKREAHTIKTTIQDDGKGFAAETIGPGSTSHGFGLVGIAERVRMLGGKHVIDSTPGHGTLITITIPMKERGKNGN